MKLKKLKNLANFHFKPTQSFLYKTTGIEPVMLTSKVNVIPFHHVFNVFRLDRSKNRNRLNQSKTKQSLEKVETKRNKKGSLKQLILYFLLG